MQAIETLFRMTWLTMIVALAFCLGSEEARAESVLYGVVHIGKSNPSILFTIDPVTGVATSVGPITVKINPDDKESTAVLKISGMDADPSGRLYATGEVQNKHALITIDSTTGEARVVGLTGIGSADIPDLKTATDISFSSGGTLYANFARPPVGAIKPRAESLGTINPLTGAASVLGTTVIERGAAIAFTYEDDTLYKAGEQLHTLNVATGEAGPAVGLKFPAVPGASSAPRINAMDVDPETEILYVSVNYGLGGNGPNFLATIDLAAINTEPVDVNIVGLDPTETGLDALAFVPVITEASPNPSLSYLTCKSVVRGRYIRKSQEVEVMLNDGNESKKVRVMNPVSLCTPVYSDGEAGIDSTSSLTCYRVKDLMRHRRSRHHRSFEWHHVYIENEFGEQNLSVIQPETLCVPSEIKDDKVKIKTHYHKRHRHSKDNMKHRRTKKHKKDNDDDD